MKIQSISIYYGNTEIYFCVEGVAYVVESNPAEYKQLIDKTDFNAYDISICRDRTYIFLKPLQENTNVLLERAKEMGLKISNMKGEVK